MLVNLHLHATRVVVATLMWLNRLRKPLWATKSSHDGSRNSLICDITMASAATHASIGGEKTHDVDYVVRMIAETIVRRMCYLSRSPEGVKADRRPHSW